MRDVMLVIGVLAMVPMMLARPFLGVLVWCWVALLVPNSYVFGFATGIRFNYWIAILTLIAWLVSPIPKRIPVNRTTVLLGCLLAWGTISATMSLDPTPSATWTEWGNFAKIIALAFVIAGLIDTELKIRALLFAIALSMGFHAVDESLKFLITGGEHKIWGPGTSIISDNNQFALATIMVIPIMIYLYTHSKSRWVRLGLAVGVLLQVIAVIGTGSRGGLIGVLALGVWIVLTTGKKVRSLVVVGIIAAIALALAPDRWYARMSTIDSASQDQSFMTRVVAWKINLLAAIDRPLVGAGFHATQTLPVWITYASEFGKVDFIPSEQPSLTVPRAAHSIYFQALGDLGFVGFALFASLLVTAWRNSSAVIQAARDNSELAWAGRLARTLQYVLVPYLVSGAALSMAYFDLSYAIFALLAVLREHSDRSVTALAGVRSRARAFGVEPARAQSSRIGVRR